MRWDGVGRDGMGRDGAGRDGTGRDGTGRDGMGRSGAGARRGERVAALLASRVWRGSVGSGRGCAESSGVGGAGLAAGLGRAWRGGTSEGAGRSSL